MGGEGGIPRCSPGSRKEPVLFSQAPEGKALRHLRVCSHPEDGPLGAAPCVGQGVARRRVFRRELGARARHAAL